MQEKVTNFSKLLRDLEAEIGTRDLANMFLHALLDTIKFFQCKDPSEFCKQFKYLVEILSKTEPKFGILNYYMAKFAKAFTGEVCGKGYSEQKWKTLVLKHIQGVLDEAKGNKQAILQHAQEIDVEHKTILIHDHSHTVQDVLAHYKKLGKHFKVVIAEQELDKTQSNIERLYAAQIPFQVVPAYMLSHITDHVDMVFFGGLTLKDTMHFVMDPGTHGIISEFHVEHKPIYMFIDTTKFSLWKSKKRGEIFIHKHTRQHHEKPIEYERIKYSHDRVPAELFTKIVTNEGVFTPDGVKKLFEKKAKKYSREM